MLYPVWKSKLAGKDIMGTEVSPTLDASHIVEALEAAQKILQRNHDHALIQRVTVAKGYLTLSKMFPSRNYQDILRKALDDLNAAVHLHLQHEESGQISSPGLARTRLSS